MLDLDDIQHILLTRAPALTGRYEFLSFREGAGRPCVAVGNQGDCAIRRSDAGDRRQGQALGDASPSPGTACGRWVWTSFAGVTFRRSSSRAWPARAEMLGDTGETHPAHWAGGLASPDLHAIVILFARDEAERVRCVGEHKQLVAACEGVEVLSVLDLEATPPFIYAHDHFGYRDRLSQPVIEGSGEEPTPGSGAPLKAGRVHPRLPGRIWRDRRSVRSRKCSRAMAATWPIDG